MGYGSIAVGAIAGLVCSGGVLAQGFPEAEPESVGMSSERLDRIGSVFQAEIDEGKLPGVVIMVARDGKLVIPRRSASWIRRKPPR